MECDFPQDFVFVGIDGSILCQDEEKSEPPSLENALKVNLAYKNTLFKLKDQLENLLYINRTNQQNLEKEIRSLNSLASPFTSLEDESDNCLPFCGIPYFKDAQLNCPPRNEDVVSIEKLRLSQNLNCSLHPNHKTMSKLQLSKLQSSVKVQAQKVKVDHLVMQSGELEEQILEAGDDPGWRRMLEKQLNAFEHQIDNICSISDGELFEGVEPSEINWERIAHENLMLGTAQELKLYWSHYLRPGVNTEPWTNEERHKLKVLVDSCGKDGVNWNQVAVQLNTKRTPFECFRCYQKWFRPIETKDNKGRFPRRRIPPTIAIKKLGRPVVQPSLSVQDKKQKLSMILRPLVCNIGKKKRTHTFPGDARNQSIVLAAFYRLLRCHFDRAPKQVMPEEELEQIGIKPLDGMSFNHLIRMMATVAPSSALIPLASEVSPLPPDYFSLVGYRGLLLHRPYLEHSKGEKEPEEQQQPQTEDVSRADQLLLFRMMTLFFWPAIMNSVGPTLQPEPKPLPSSPPVKYRKMTKHQLRRFRTNNLLKVHQKKRSVGSNVQPVDESLPTEPDCKKQKLVPDPSPINKL